MTANYPGRLREGGSMKFKFRLSHEIILMMIVKLAIIYVIYSLCFSHPIDKSLTSADMAQHFVQLRKT